MELPSSQRPGASLAFGGGSHGSLAGRSKIKLVRNWLKGKKRCRLVANVLHMNLAYQGGL